SNIYGPRAQMKHPHFGVVNWFVRLAIEGKTIKLFSDGKIKRDFVYIDDCVEAVLRIARHEPAARGEIYNIGVDVPSDFRAVVDALCELVPGTKWEFAPFTPERAAQEPGDFYSDVTKIRAATGWSAHTPLRDGLDRTITYYRAFAEHYL